MDNSTMILLVIIVFALVAIAVLDQKPQSFKKRNSALHVAITREIGDRPQAIGSAQAALETFVEIEDPGAEEARRKLAEWGAENYK
jgi:hypothetical protein